MRFLFFFVAFFGITQFAYAQNVMNFLNGNPMGSPFSITSMAPRPIIPRKPILHKNINHNNSQLRKNIYLKTEINKGYTNNYPIDVTSLSKNCSNTQSLQQLLSKKCLSQINVKPLIKKDTEGVDINTVHNKLNPAPNNDPQSTITNNNISNKDKPKNKTVVPIILGFNYFPKNKDNSKINNPENKNTPINTSKKIEENKAINQVGYNYE